MTMKITMMSRGKAGRGGAWLLTALALFLLTACEFSSSQQPPTAVSSSPLVNNETDAANPVPTATEEAPEVEVVSDELIVLPTLPATAVPLPTPTYSPRNRRLDGSRLP